MDPERARALLTAERDDIRRLLGAGQQDAEEARAEQAGSGAGDYGDAAGPLNAEEDEQAVAGALGDRLERVERALRRLDAGTYGRSVVSGKPIPDQRLEADPAAEATVEEASELERRR
jgi:DnaK suppressor protein